MLQTILQYITLGLAVFSIKAASIVPAPLKASNIEPSCANIPCDDTWVRNSKYCGYTCGNDASAKCYEKSPTCEDIRRNQYCNAAWVKESKFCKFACSTKKETTNKETCLQRAPRLDIRKYPFYVGANVPWVAGHYGWSFGVHPQWGAGYDPKWMQQFLSDLDTAVPRDINVGILARVFVFADLRSFSFSNGAINGLPDELLNDMIDMLDKAAKTRVKMVLSLLDFHVCDEHCAVLWDENNLRSLMNNAIIPFLKRINKHPAVWCIEPMNEPEWAIKESGRAFTKQQMGVWNAQSYSARVNAAVHKYTNFLTACGSGSAMWSSYWTDNALKGAYSSGGNDVGFDIMMSHMYSFSAPNYDVFSRPASQFSNGKPMIIGECGKNDPLDYASKLRQACELGYIGLLPWSYGASDGVASWEDIKPALQNFKGCTPPSHREL